ncbi:MAG: hypothetical protein K8R10_15170 [Rhodocyclales bacterium]|jgi:hypothetical protein|nr:hypothetical protein [Rhodocyclales bacterium]
MNLSTMLDPNTLALLDQLGISAATVESALASLAIFTILTLVTAIPTVILAKRKGRSVAGWLLLALSLPVLPLLLVWLLPTLPQEPRR